MNLKSEKLAWLLLALSWGWFSATKGTLSRILSNPMFKNNKFPWLLLVGSYSAFFVGLKTKFLTIAARKRRIHTAKYEPPVLPSNVSNEAPKLQIAAQSSTQPTVQSTVQPQQLELNLTEMSSGQVLDLIKSNHSHADVVHRFPDISYYKEFFKMIWISKCWTEKIEMSGISISKLSMTDLELPFIRGDGFLEGDWTLEEILSVINNPIARMKWDARFASGEALEYLSSGTALVYSVQHGAFPVAARDIVTVVSNEYESQELLLSTISSVNDPLAPPADANGKVRAVIMLAGWRLEKVAKGVLVTYLVHVDPRGYIPSSLIKKVQTQTPMGVHGVFEYLTSVGTMPFVMIHEDFRPSKDVKFLRVNLHVKNINIQYQVSPFENGQKGIFYLALPIAFSSGAKITAQIEEGEIVLGASIVSREDCKNVVSKHTSLVLKFFANSVGLKSRIVLNILPNSNNITVFNGQAI